MWHHFWSLIWRSWHALTNATSTSTLGFLIWTVLLTALGWTASVAAKWFDLRKARTPVSFQLAVEESLRAGVFQALAVFVLVICSWAAFVVITVYEDHQGLVARIKELKQQNGELAAAVELRRHTLVRGDPVFSNTYALMMAFDSYRHYQHGKPCVVMLTAPPETGTIVSVVAQFSNAISDCTTFGPMNANIDPAVEKRTNEGIVPNVIVFHAAQEDKAGDQLFNQLSSLIPLKRSYDLPKDRVHLYSIPNAGQETLIWFQFGPNVKWSEQIQ